MKEIREFVEIESITKQRYKDTTYWVSSTEAGMMKGESTDPLAGESTEILGGESTALLPGESTVILAGELSVTFPEEFTVSFEDEFAIGWRGEGVGIESSLNFLEVDSWAKHLSPDSAATAGIELACDFPLGGEFACFFLGGESVFFEVSDLLIDADTFLFFFSAIARFALLSACATDALMAGFGCLFGRLVDARVSMM